MATGKGTNITVFLEKHRDRYPKEASGILCGIWVQRMHHVGNFLDAVRGTVPSEDLAIIGAYVNGGNLQQGLLELGKMVKRMDECKKATKTTLMMAFVMFLIFNVFVGIQAFMVLPQLMKAMLGAIKASQFTTLANSFFGGAEIVRTWWPLWLAFLIGTSAWIIWSLSNYTGRFRPWLDRHILFYQIYRDFNGASFLAALSAITRTGGAQVLGLMDALKLMGENSYPWLSWHIERIQQNLIRNPNSKGEIFNTGFLSKASLYRVQDIAEYSQLSPMLAQAGDLIMSTAPAEIQKRAVSLRYTMMIITLLTMIGIYAGTYAMVYEFKSTIELQTAFF